MASRKTGDTYFRTILHEPRNAQMSALMRLSLAPLNAQHPAVEHRLNRRQNEQQHRAGPEVERVQGARPLEK